MYTEVTGHVLVEGPGGGGNGCLHWVAPGHQQARTRFTRHSAKLLWTAGDRYKRLRLTLISSNFWAVAVLRGKLIWAGKLGLFSSLSGPWWLLSLQS